MMFMLLFLKAGMLPILHRSVSQSTNHKRSLITHYSQVGSRATTKVGAIALRIKNTPPEPAPTRLGFLAIAKRNAR